MNLRFTHRADKDFATLPKDIRKEFAKQLGFMVENLSHQTLQAKKYIKTDGI